MVMKAGIAKTHENAWARFSRGRSSPTSADVIGYIKDHAIPFKEYIRNKKLNEGDKEHPNADKNAKVNPARSSVLSLKRMVRIPMAKAVSRAMKRNVVLS